MITIGKEDGRIIVKFSYNPDYIAKLKLLMDISGVLRKNTGVFRLIIVL